MKNSPRVSEDDEKVARVLVNKWYDADLAPAPQLIAAIAQDRAFVRDAARLAERERVRGAVKALLSRSYDHSIDDAVLSAIDGQPEGGKE